MEKDEKIIGLHNDICQIIQDEYIKEVRDLSKYRVLWRKVGNYTDTASKILVGAGIIIAYCEGYFRTGYLSLIAGSVGTAGVVAREFSHYAQHDSKQREMSLRVALTDGYQYIRQFMNNPLELKAPSLEERKVFDEDNHLTGGEILSV